MTIISKHAKVQTLFRSRIRFICFWFGLSHDSLPVFAYFLDKFWSNDLDLSSRKVKVI